MGKAARLDASRVKALPDGRVSYEGDGFLAWVYFKVEEMDGYRMAVPVRLEINANSGGRLGSTYRALPLGLLEQWVNSSRESAWGVMGL